MADGFQCPSCFSTVKEGEPVHQVTQQEDNEGPFKHFRQEGSVTIVFGFRETQGIAYGKQKRREYQVGGGKPKPFSVVQRRIVRGPSAGRVHNDHKTNGKSPENIERKKSFVGKGP